VVKKFPNQEKSTASRASCPLFKGEMRTLQLPSLHRGDSRDGLRKRGDCFFAQLIAVTYALIRVFVSSFVYSRTVVLALLAAWRAIAFVLFVPLWFSLLFTPDAKEPGSSSKPGSSSAIN
jgi:hypothetical protein